jgi:hypothetical protein
MVTDGLIAVQDVRIVKAVSKDKKIPEPAPPRKIVATRAKLVRIYLGEADKYKDEPLYEAIVKRLRMLDFAGATVYRAILGYGLKGHTHKAGRLHLSHDLPVMISIIEKPERVNELIQVVCSIMPDGLIVTSDVELQQIVHEIPKTGDEVRDEQPTR